MDIVIFVQSLKTEERIKIFDINKKTFPKLKIFQSINGYNINETINELFKSKLKFKRLDFNTYGTLANFITKVNAFKYQVENNIEYMCLLEDDLILNDNFEIFLQGLLPKLKSYNMIRLCNWGEGYLTSITGARNILTHIYNIGIIRNIDNQLRDNCGSELYVQNTPFTLVVKSNEGDCLKTEKIFKWRLLRFNKRFPLW